MVRFRGLIDYFLPKPVTWEKRLASLPNFDPLKAFQDLSIPDHIRVSFPKEYFDRIVSSYGKEKALSICKTSNEQAPTTLRANPLKISRDELIILLEKQGLNVKKTSHSSLGIICEKRENFYTFEEFKEGFFEVQDEGSQLISFLVSPTEEDQVLDFCCGAGGKTLGFAWKMKNKGQVYLHDIRETAYLQAKKRLHRAGIQNYQCLFSDTSQEKKLKGKMDWIMLDVPCSGSGTLRRNPDLKWKFTQQNLDELIKKQQAIFEESFSFGKKGCKIVYATCSIFPEENERQIEFFLKTFPLKLINSSSWVPESQGMDGFFGAVLEKES